jgi:hypothetical protein
MKIGAVVYASEDDMHTSQYWSNRSSKTTSTLPEVTQKGPTSGLDGLDFQRHCVNCGHAQQLSIFAPPPAPETPSKRARRGQTPSSRCSNCKPRQSLPTRLPCVVCGEVVDGMLVPCLGCGHVSCFSCHRRWFLQTRSSDQFDSPFYPPEDTNVLPTCPTGCGCNCSEYVTADVPMPVWETPMSPGTKPETAGLPHRNASHEKRHRRRQSEPPSSRDSSGRNTPTSKAGVGQLQDDLDLWQTSSPFASLARGMGGGLSQGLRTKDDRKKNRTVAIATPKGKGK